MLASAAMPPQVRHRVDLMPTIDGLFRQHGATPDQLGEIYVSIGPGSFTGLRIAIATARTLAQTLGCRLVAVPTLDVVAGNVPLETAASNGAMPSRLAVGLNLKKESLYVGVYDWSNDAGWRAAQKPALMTLPELLAAHANGGNRGLAILADPLPALPDPLPQGVTILPTSLAVPDSRQVWRLGQTAANRGDFTPTLQLSPLYVRQPEAVELWNKRHGTS